MAQHILSFPSCLERILFSIVAKKSLCLWLPLVTIPGCTLIFVLQFISSRGNEYFCEIDEDYLTDRFNLTGINADVQYYQHALDLVTDVFDLDCDDDMREEIEKSARHLYGLVHARYITTTRGLAKMVCPDLILHLVHGFSF